MPELIKTIYLYPFTSFCTFCMLYVLLDMILVTIQNILINKK